MKLDEIILIPDRDEYHDQYLYHFEKAKIIAKVNNHDLKKYKDDTDLYYGLFRVDGHLIAYFHLEKSNNYYQISFISVVNEYRGQGYMTYLFDYAINNDNLKIISDARQTFLAKDMWSSFVRNDRFKVYWYNIDTDEKILVKRINNEFIPSPWIEPEDHTWKNAENIRLIAEKKYITKEEERILKEQDLKRKQDRIIIDYGPGTTSAQFWNP